MACQSEVCDGVECLGNEVFNLIVAPGQVEGMGQEAGDILAVVGRVGDGSGIVDNIVFSNVGDGGASSFIFQPFDVGATDLWSVRAPLNLVAMSRAVAKIPSELIPGLGVADLVFLGVVVNGGLEVARKWGKLVSRCLVVILNRQGEAVR
jgi:hypothetical protein